MTLTDKVIAAYNPNLPCWEIPWNHPETVLRSTNYTALSDGPNISLQDWDTIPEADALVEKIGVKIDTSPRDRAFYDIKFDRVMVPSQSQFSTQVKYYGSYFHELAHSTGHAKRLNRFGITGRPARGSIQYAFEELIAEMSALRLCEHFGISEDDNQTFLNSVVYLKSWVDTCDGFFGTDKKTLERAERQVERVVEYLIGEKVEDRLIKG